MQPSAKNNLLHCLVMLNSSAKAMFYARDYDDAWEFYHAENQAPFDAAQMLLGVVGEQDPTVGRIVETGPSLHSLAADSECSEHHFPRLFGGRLSGNFPHHQTGIATFKRQLETLIRTECIDSNFDRNEIELVRENEFYRFIDFDALR